MDYVWFSVGFFVLHLGAYVVAGVLNQQLVSRDLYGGEQALYAPFFRDMDDPAERRRQGPRDGAVRGDRLQPAVRRVHRLVAVLSA